jgi:phage gpG-like protein
MAQLKVLVKMDSDTKDTAEHDERLRDLRRPLSHWGEYMIGSYQNRLRSGGRTSTPGLPPVSRHQGGLLQSMSYAIQGYTGISMGSSKIYAAILHFGGIISRKPGGPYLAIPVNDAARRLSDGAGSLRSITGLVFRGYTKVGPFGNRRVGILGFVKNAGKKNERFQPMFSLWDWVRIQAHPYLEATEKDLEKLNRILADWIGGRA